MARPSIVPIALTVDDRTGYTLWAPPWEEDGEEWQAFLGTTEDDPDSGSTAKVHLFPSPAALAAFCRTSTDHDLADHPVWPVVAGLDAADMTPDDDHRYDLDGVYDIAAENPDRWAVEELAATIDIVSRLAECLDTSPEPDEELDDAETDGQFEAVAELAAKPEIGSLGLGVDAFVGRSGEDAWVGVGGVLDDLWEDVVEELSEHLDWTGAGSVSVEDYPPASEVEQLDADDLPDDIVPVDDEPGVRTIARGGRITASPAEVAEAGKFWESVGILPVEIVVPEGAGVTLRCYVEDVARFLGQRRGVRLRHPRRPGPLHHGHRGPRPDGDRLLGRGRRHRRPAAARRPGPLRPHRALRRPRRGRRRRRGAGRPPGVRAAGRGRP